MQTRDNHLIFKGLVVNIEQMDVQVGCKGWHTYQVVRHPGGVAVLPLHDDGSVTLIRQLRPAISTFTIELPAGRLDSGENPADCARRELLEETGLSAQRLESLGIIHTSPGVFDEMIHLYLAVDLCQGEPQPEQYEDIETFRLPLDEAVQMACDGRISDGKTIAALLRASRRDA